MFTTQLASVKEKSGIFHKNVSSKHAIFKVAHPGRTHEMGKQ
jgi:hypothetical protein